MRKVSIFVCVLLLLFTLSACGSQSTGEESQTNVAEQAENSGENSSGVWSKNEFTEQVPEPDFEISTFEVSENELTVMFSNADLKGMRDYREKVIEAGFTIDAESEDMEVVGMTIFHYQASNEAGYVLELFSTAGTDGMTISK